MSSTSNLMTLVSIVSEILALNPHNDRFGDKRKELKQRLEELQKRLRQDYLDENEYL